MKKNLVKIIALLIVVVVLSSCNRGVGCPSDFSLDAVWNGILTTLQHLF